MVKRSFSEHTRSTAEFTLQHYISCSTRKKEYRLLTTGMRKQFSLINCLFQQNEQASKKPGEPDAVFLFFCSKQHSLIKMTENELRTCVYTFCTEVFLPCAHSPQPAQHRAPLTRRILSSPGPQRCMEGCGSGCECSSGPPASPSHWGNQTLHPAPASPPPEVTQNMIRGTLVCRVQKHLLSQAHCLIILLLIEQT